VATHRALTIFVAACLIGGCASAPVVQAPAAPRVVADRLMDDVRILSADDMQGRAPGTEGSARARAYIVRRLEEIGVEPAVPRFEQSFTFATKVRATEGVNIVGRIEGWSRSSKVLVVMAHYDHLGVVDGQVYNGADDNASGVAAALAVAQAFADDPPRHDILIAIVDAEEGGLRGSRVLAAAPPVPRERVALVVNFDMLSKNTKNELYVAGGAHFPWLKRRLEALVAKAPVSLKLGHDTPAWGDQDWTAESDHAAFGERGIPWAYFGVEDHPDYHRPTDDFASIPQDFFRRSTATAIAAVRAFDDDLDAIAEEAGR
jgi:Zn-dependent M28 family amino/carboxypeptidase